MTTDDVASAPRDQREKRRGVAGNFFVFKVTGAAADAMMSLDDCERIARHANDRTFTVGVALSPCSLPQNADAELRDRRRRDGSRDGDPRRTGRVAREPIGTADQVTDDILDRIFAEMPAKSGDKVAVLVNSLGSTPLMELYLLNRRVKQRLDARGIGVHATWVGAYCTSLEMAGASITLMLLDDELRACSTALRLRDVPRRMRLRSTEGMRAMNEFTTRDVLALFERITVAISGRQGSALPARRRDRRCGSRRHHVDLVFWRLQEALRSLDAASTDPAMVFNTAAKSFLNAVGASSGPLYATAFMRAGAVAKGKTTLDRETVVAVVAAIAKGIQDRGKGERGDKTMLDAWLPAAEAAEQARAEDKDLTVCLEQAVAAGVAGAEATKNMVASKGRASRLGERAIGHMDPGAASAVILLTASAETASASGLEQHR